MVGAVDRLREEINPLINRVTERLNSNYLDPVRVTINDGEPHQKKVVRLSSVGQVIVIDNQTLSVVPFDSMYDRAIEQAIYGSDLNLSPRRQADGSLIITVPKLTIEKRKALVKESGQIFEVSRSSIKSLRQSAQKASKLDLDSNLITKDDFKANSKVLDEISRINSKAIDDIESRAKKILLDDH
ncbi:ribosome recycling factor domain-containing protein [Phakopsora pachyrhizi]|uniref:Ribosome recycling factor domain-containing protein n=1 Tax=Phakopsora pachyrhizi TaxID=170000 RepID=A0AAV0B154_PHAPC|nr:ribosome recycling factor domain-containing protein [Phakopsora pachyrhizi]